MLKAIPLSSQSLAVPQQNPHYVRIEKREAAGNPIRVAMVGAGYMARGIAASIINGITGTRLVAVSNRTLSEAQILRS